MCQTTCTENFLFLDNNFHIHCKYMYKPTNPMLLRLEEVKCNAVNIHTLKILDAVLAIMV